MLRVFISSTIRDLLYVRSTLATQLETSLGHKVTISDSDDFDWLQGNIIESCLREVAASDVYILIIGSRYGSQIEAGLSITKAEYLQALAENKPILVLAEQEIWSRYTIAPESIDPHVKSFLDEVGSQFRRNIKRFGSSEEAYQFVRNQLSNLLHNYLDTHLTVRQIHDILRAKDKMERDARAFVTIIAQSDFSSSDYSRILAVVMQAVDSGILYSEETVPQPLTQLSNVIGATIFQLENETETLRRIGDAGDIGDQTAFVVNDTDSFVAKTLRSGETKLFVKMGLESQKEYILCMPIQQTYVFTLHFLVVQEFAPDVEEQSIIDSIFEKNRLLFDVFNIYLERGTPRVQTV